jgi:hypothetical protein
VGDDGYHLAIGTGQILDGSHDVEKGDSSGLRLGHGGAPSVVFRPTPHLNPNQVRWFTLAQNPSLASPYRRGATDKGRRAQESLPDM